MFVLMSLLDLRWNEVLRFWRWVMIFLVLLVKGKVVVSIDDGCWEFVGGFFGCFSILDMICFKYLFVMLRLLIKMMKVMILFFGGKLFWMLGLGRYLFCILCWIRLIKLVLRRVWIVGMIFLMIFFWEVEMDFLMMVLVIYIMLLIVEMMNGGLFLIVLFCLSVSLLGNLFSWKVFLIECWKKNLVSLL